MSKILDSTLVIGVILACLYLTGLVYESFLLRHLGLPQDLYIDDTMMIITGLKSVIEMIKQFPDFLGYYAIFLIVVWLISKTPYLSRFQKYVSISAVYRWSFFGFILIFWVTGLSFLTIYGAFAGGSKEYIGLTENNTASVITNDITLKGNLLKLTSDYVILIPKSTSNIVERIDIIPVSEIRRINLALESPWALVESDPDEERD